MSVAKKPIEVTDETIAVRAYQRWMGRGCPTTDGADDWFAARSELEAEQSAPSRTAPRRASRAKTVRPSC
jgi:hypothetical protein